MRFEVQELNELQYDAAAQQWRLQTLGDTAHLDVEYAKDEDEAWRWS